jgi:hypothetical protein
MSRRVTVFMLAASTALIATQAWAAPKCVGESCAATPSEAQLRSQRSSARHEKRAASSERLFAEASGLADERWRSHHGYGRNGYVVGLPVTTGSVVVAPPAFVYGGYLGRPVYLFAPNAKIITLDRGQD